MHTTAAVKMMAMTTARERKYDAETKTKAVGHVLAGGLSVVQVANWLNLDPNTVQSWVDEARQQQPLLVAHKKREKPPATTRRRKDLSDEEKAQDYDKLVAQHKRLTARTQRLQQEYQQIQEEIEFLKKLHELLAKKKGV